MNETKPTSVRQMQITHLNNEDQHLQRLIEDLLEERHYLDDHATFDGIEEEETIKRLVQVTQDIANYHKRQATVQADLYKWRNLP